MKATIIYGSTTDNTSNIAKQIAEALADYSPNVVDVSGASEADFAADLLILGTSTWGAGDLQDDWDSFLPTLEGIDLSGKTVALFGVGDSAGYSDTFCDGVGILFEAVKGKGCKIIGAVSTDGYSFDESRAVVDDKFVGLAIDEDNESSETPGRISNWVAQLKSEL